jgi:hypothetical protein
MNGKPSTAFGCGNNSLEAQRCRLEKMDGIETAPIIQTFAVH